MPLYGESFWQCRSPIHSSQLWSQNMQDLGVYEDIFYKDDFNMPDIDLSFWNFEDLFGGDQDPTRALLGDKDFCCSYMEKDMSFNKSDNGNARAMKGIIGSPCTIRPSNSTMSFSVSRFGAESSGTECLDTRFSPIAQGEASCISADLDSLHSEARENAMMRYKEKKAARL